MPKTGATRYQKFLKSEKSKTKLKAKKDLPKGTNVTKTNFKVKKIVIKEQLKKHIESEWLSTRKLNVTELLSRLKHFNIHTKKEALDGLKELINSHPEVLEQTLGQLINGVTPLILDIEIIIRRESLQVLHKILSKASIEKIEPFYDIMSTYLRSAMTNIDYRLQEDSLLFLDILLECAPQKVAEDFHKIIPNFLSMISKLRVDSKPGRTLTVNLGSQITSVRWRVKVLNRLQDYLGKFIQYEHVYDSDREIIGNTKIFDTETVNHYPLFNPNYTAVCHLASFSSKKTQKTMPVDEVGMFTEFIDTLMPLLLETWLEVCPKKNMEQNLENVVSEDAAHLLKYTLKVMTLIWSLVQYYNKKNPSCNIESIFCQKYSQQFTRHFVKTFPFVTNPRSKHHCLTMSLLRDYVIDPKLVAENLEICNLFILLNPKINIKDSNLEILSVLNYIEKTFNQYTQNKVNIAVIKILNTIFSQVNGWTNTLSVMDALLRKIIWSYFNKNMSIPFKQRIFGLLCQIALNENLEHFHKTDAFDKWRSNLPDVLFDRTIDLQTINIIQKYASRYNKSFNDAIKPKLLGIIHNLPFIKITDAVNDNCYHKLFSLLYWIKKWDDASLDLLENQLLIKSSIQYKNDHIMFIFETLKLSIKCTCNKSD